MPNQAPTPVIDPNLPFRTWNKAEIFDPDNPSQDAVYVPNVNDMVLDWYQGFYRVIQVDYTTGKSLLQPWHTPQQSLDNEEIDILLGSGPGTESDSFRAFINSDLHPSTLALDARLEYKGSEVTSIKIFRGTDISETGEVISKFYDSSWNLLGENIPLELSSIDPLTNLTVKNPKVGYTTSSIDDGERLTVVAYNDLAGPVSVATVIAQNSSFIRPAEANALYITSIGIDAGPFTNPSDPTNIRYPVNMPVDNLQLMGTITYSDGSTKSLPIDGTKFQLFGLEHYIATQEGQTIPLVLVYRLDANEYTYNGALSAGGDMTQEYSATTQPMDGSYSIKIYPYPYYDEDVGIYRLRVYLYNLEREDVYDITDIYELGTQGSAFDGNLYGAYQHINFAVQMDQVDPSFKAWRFVEPVSIALRQDGLADSGDLWNIKFTTGQNPPYGKGSIAKVEFINAAFYNVDISCGETNKEDWLKRVYERALPLFNERNETEAPEPNIFVLTSNTARVEYSIDQWNETLVLQTALSEGDNIYIEWIKRDAQNDLQLGISALPIRQIN